MKTIDWPWAILLCRFADRPFEPQLADHDEDLFAHHGAGGQADYWRGVTFGNIDLTARADGTA